MKPRAVWLFALLPLVGVLELAAALRDNAVAPREADYDALAAAVASVHRDGDLVVVAPRWAEPHVRRALGDAYFPLAALARSDSARFERALEISALGERSEELKSFRELARTSSGEFEIRVLENPKPEHVLFDFVERLEPAWASASGTDPVTRCVWSDRARVASGGLGGHPTFPAQRFVCPEDFYLNVSATIIADERFLPRRCIYAHPPETGARVVRFERVPLGERVVGHSGMYWVIERSHLGTPVKLEVVVDGDSIGSVEHVDGDGWKGFSLPLGAHSGAPSATVEFIVSASDNANRHFCFQADTR